MTSVEENPLEIDCAAVKRLLDAGTEMLLLDCREQDEYELVRIDGSSLLPMSELVGRAEELAPHRDRQVVVYCHHGGRSLQTAAWLRKQGFHQAQSMAGGVDQWAVEIDPSLPRY